MLRLSTRLLLPVRRLATQATATEPAKFVRPDVSKLLASMKGTHVAEDKTAEFVKLFPGLLSTNAADVKEAELDLIREFLKQDADPLVVVASNQPTTRKVKVASISFKGYDFRILDLYSSFVINSAAKMGMPISGIVRLPTKIKRWTVLRSPHGDKKSRDQFEMRTHKRVLTVFNAHPTTVEKFATYVEMHMPPGMAMRVVRYTFHQLPTSIRIAGAPPAAT